MILQAVAFLRRVSRTPATVALSNSLTSRRVHDSDRSIQLSVNPSVVQVILAIGYARLGAPDRESVAVQPIAPVGVLVIV